MKILLTLSNCKGDRTLNFSIVFNQVSTLLIIIVIGYIASRLNIITEQVNKKLSEILLNITSPLLIFSSFLMEYSREKLVNAGYVMGLGLVMFIVSIILAEKVLFIGQEEKKKPVLKAAAVFSNCGYMGFPVIDSILGQEGVFYASMYVSIFYIFLWSYGVIIYSGKKTIKTVGKAFVSPAMIAVYIGAIVFLLQIPVPYFISSPAQMVGGMTTPLAMLIIGAIIAQTKLIEAFKGLVVYYASFLRLVALPILSLGIAMLLRIPTDAMNIVAIVLAMPVGVNVAVFAEKFDLEPLLGSKVVTISTILSVITIPVFLLALL